MKAGKSKLALTLDLRRLESHDERPEFDCGHGDLNEFFRVDSIEARNQLLAVTYVFEDAVNESVAAFFSIFNDSVSRKLFTGSTFKRMFPHEKRYKSVPAVKIGRLGTHKRLQGHGVGTQILDFLKVWFTENNKTGCRVIVVDAYNNDQTLNFYQKNGFKFLLDDDKKGNTRLMYFDLISFSSSE